MNTGARLECLVRMTGITKRFGRVVANDNVNFDLRKGEIHALVGENGAGKTTLMGVLYGLVHPEGGRISVSDRDVTIRSPRDAIRLGIGMVQQRPMLVEALTVAENIVLGREPRAGIFLRRRRAREEALRALSSLGSKLAPAARVGSLSAAECQTVEIAKLVHAEAKIIILDEPTSYLSPLEVRELFSLVGRLKAGGRSVVFISHKLNEVLAIADRLTVLRRGKVQATLPRSEASEETVARLMVGEEKLETQVHTSAPVGATLMQIDNLSVGGRVHDLSLSVHRGEIVGVAGLAGSGQRELVAGILGLMPRRSGRVSLRGRDITSAGAAAAFSLGTAYVPDRALERGLLPDLSLEENAVLGLHRLPSFSACGWMRWRAVGSYADGLVEDFDIRGSRGLPAGALSGGNQQKLVVARELSKDADIFVLEQPTRGLDIQATRSVRNRMGQLRSAGKAVLLISYDLDELLELCDRVAVLVDGRIVAVRPRAGLTREALGLLMTGAGGSK